MNKSALLIIISLLAASCYLPPPPVDCEFINLKKSNAFGLNKSKHFVLKFKSSHNLATLEKEYNGANLFLYCPLSDNDYKSYYGNGIIQIGSMAVTAWYDDLSTVPIYFDKGWYYYEFPIDFEDNIDRSRSKELSDRRIDSVLNNKSCVPCNFVMPYFFALNKVFYTDTFLIPSDSIRKLLIVDKLENK